MGITLAFTKEFPIGMRTKLVLNVCQDPRSNNPVSFYKLVSIYPYQGKSCRQMLEGFWGRPC
jgi:hypothetical protein